MWIFLWKSKVNLSFCKNEERTTMTPTTQEETFENLWFEKAVEGHGSELAP